MFACLGGTQSAERGLGKEELKSQRKLQKLERKRSLHHSSHKQNELGFSFSGAGFLFPYYAGVTSMLLEQQIIKPGQYLAGTSAGSLIAVNVNSGVSVERGLESSLSFSANCRTNGTKGRLKQALIENLEQFLPEDAHELASHKTFVALTQAVPFRARIISHWHSRADLIKCLVASCHLPRFSDDKITTEFRGKGHMDGGVLCFLPPIPSIPTPSGARKILTVGVSAFPSKLIPKLPVMFTGTATRLAAITPDSFDTCSWTLKELMESAMEPAPEKFLLQLYEKGRLDACRWAHHMGLIMDCPAADNRLSALPPSQPNGPSTASRLLLPAPEAEVKGAKNGSSLGASNAVACPFQEALLVATSLSEAQGLRAAGAAHPAPVQQQVQADDNPPAAMQQGAVPAALQQAAAARPEA